MTAHSARRTPLFYPQPPQPAPPSFADIAAGRGFACRLFGSRQEYRDFGLGIGRLQVNRDGVMNRCANFVGRKKSMERITLAGADDLQVMRVQAVGLSHRRNCQFKQGARTFCPV